MNKYILPVIFLISFIKLNKFVIIRFLKVRRIEWNGNMNLILRSQSNLNAFNRRFLRLFCSTFWESSSILKIFTSFYSPHFKEPNIRNLVKIIKVWYCYQSIEFLVIIINRELKISHICGILYLWIWGSTALHTHNWALIFLLQNYSKILYCKNCADYYWNQKKL